MDVEEARVAISEHMVLALAAAHRRHGRAADPSGLRDRLGRSPPPCLR
jgi:hypothetical protein